MHWRRRGSIHAVRAASLIVRAQASTIEGTMEPTYFAQYLGFNFQCSPQRIGARSFAPRLVIFDSSQTVSLEIPLSVPVEPFTDPTAAAHEAFAHGRHWVDSGFDNAASAAAAMAAKSLLDE
jgi:hypothetical protein